MFLLEVTEGGKGKAGEQTRSPTDQSGTLYVTRTSTRTPTSNVAETSMSWRRCGAVRLGTGLVGSQGSPRRSFIVVGGGFACCGLERSRCCNWKNEQTLKKGFDVATLVLRWWKGFCPEQKTRDQSPNRDSGAAHRRRAGIRHPDRGPHHIAPAGRTGPHG